MERCVALFISGRKGFFREKACINCSVDEYCACEGADILFDIDGVMRKELVDIGEGISISISNKISAPSHAQYSSIEQLIHPSSLKNPSLPEMKSATHLFISMIRKEKRPNYRLSDSVFSRL